MRYEFVLAQRETHWELTFPLLPGVTVLGESKESAITYANDDLLEAMEARFKSKIQIPIPATDCASEDCIEVMLCAWAKILLMNMMLERKVTVSELARRAGAPRDHLVRLLELNRGTHLDAINVLFKAMGTRLLLTSTD